MSIDPHRPPLVGAMPEISRAIRSCRLHDALCLLREHMDDGLARVALAALVDTEPSRIRMAARVVL